MAFFLRIVGSVALVVSLIFTVPIALWVTAGLAAGLSVEMGGPRYYWWTGYLGWGVMLSVTALTLGAVYRIWKPTFTDETE